MTGPQTFVEASYSPDRGTRWVACDSGFVTAAFPDRVNMCATDGIHCFSLCISMPLCWLQQLNWKVIELCAALEDDVNSIHQSLSTQVCNVKQNIK